MRLTSHMDWPIVVAAMTGHVHDLWTAAVIVGTPITVHLTFDGRNPNKEEPYGIVIRRSLQQKRSYLFVFWPLAYKIFSFLWLLIHPIADYLTKIHKVYNFFESTKIIVNGTVKVTKYFLPYCDIHLKFNQLPGVKKIGSIHRMWIFFHLFNADIKKEEIYWEKKAILLPNDENSMSKSEFNYWCILLFVCS